MRRPVVVQYFKHPGDLHWRHDMVYLGEDEHGTWLGGPAGTVVQRGTEPARRWPYPFVQLITLGRWWSLQFNGDHHPDYWLYVDVVMPARWVGDDRVEMVDLDLDVVRRSDGSVEVLDEDEFLDHSQRFGYPPQVIDRARASAAELVLHIGSGREPFGTVGEAWLARLRND